MTDAKITPELIAKLRERYTPPTIPPCRVCGGELSVAQVGGGQPTEWVCSGKEDDPERPGWLRDAPGRWANAPDGGSSEFRADGHYARSRWTDYRQGGDSDVVAVLDALEALAQQPAAVDEASAWKPIAEAPSGKLCIVGWQVHEAGEYPDRHEFDFIEDGRWVHHDENVENAEAVAPPGSEMPQAEAPYQWFIEIPDFPGLAGQQGGAK